MKDVKYGLENREKFDKEAIVTKREWLEKTVDAVDKIFPTIDIKGFSFDEKEEAKTWIQS